MGNTFEVWAWDKSEDSEFYEYVLFYAGQDYDEAIRSLNKLKESGCGCAKLEWR